MSLGIIIAVLFGIVVVLGLIGKFSNSSNVVVTGPGVIKTSDVECRFKSGKTHHGKLDQDSWSDGQERFFLRLHALPGGSDPVLLYQEDQLVSQFERSGAQLDFRWKGTASDEIPAFEIGQRLRIEVGGIVLEGVVEAD